MRGYGGDGGSDRGPEHEVFRAFGAPLPTAATLRFEHVPGMLVLTVIVEILYLY